MSFKGKWEFAVSEVVRCTELLGDSWAASPSPELLLPTILMRRPCEITRSFDVVLPRGFRGCRGRVGRGPEGVLCGGREDVRGELELGVVGLTKLRGLESRLL